MKMLMSGSSTLRSGFTAIKMVPCDGDVSQRARKIDPISSSVNVQLAVAQHGVHHFKCRERLTSQTGTMTPWHHDRTSLDLVLRLGSP